MQNRLQRLQNCTAGYVIGKYATTVDVLNLNWLPIVENTQYNISKLAYQSLHDKNWPKYLPLKLIERKRNLRSSQNGPMINYGEKNTFQLQAHEIFNTLPINIKTCETQKSFTNNARSFYKDEAFTRILSI